MGNPLISQGSLNRLRGSIVFTSASELNITAPFLGKEGIRLALEGESTVMLPQMTGVVTSPEPYLMASISINLIKTQSLAALFKARMELNSLLGDLTVRPDAAALGVYQFSNCAIQSTPDLNFAGDDAAYRTIIKGTYYINSSLWEGS